MQPRVLNARRRERGCGTAAGFTLIEVMVVTIIISVIVAAVLFSVDITGGQKTRTAVSDVQLLMQGLSNEAILEGGEYGLRWERKGQRFVPVVGKGNGWSPYSGAPGERPSFKPVSWKGVADAVITVDGAVFDERMKDDENFYAGWDKEKASKAPLIRFLPTGLWEPAGEIEFFVGNRPYARLEWTAAGRMSFERGDAP